MTNKFGFLSKLDFMQDLASVFIAGINPGIIHNLEKYYALKKVHYLSAIEDIEGDYLEFGVFTGSSFCHSIRCCKKLAKIAPKISSTKFYGFDSFAGFGDLTEEDKHPFYTDENFSTSLSNVNRRVRRVAAGLDFKLIPGFFSESLKNGASHLDITKSRVIFIDSDTYSSAYDALTFCIPTIQAGTFIILDDYYSYRGAESRGVARAFNEFVSKSGVKIRQVFTYGMGGVVFVVSEVVR
ncbi:TylF/MycF/NovP-related O-methyltransferase [Candidatus Thiosymbion oneisti]|uniref:TylF/MycF/NovP-related O-methyltransferase n=1 Tax=Candidatus Thiosymbion oneisti TaxID=589554 RepID=UPI000AFCED67|nr:TylF/MycF/NovP-related O-methyltransferase [Candidatus Thiosymbion oneisti]